MPETLRSRLEQVSKTARLSGAIEPITTRVSFVEEAGIRFVARMIEAVDRKDSAKESRKKSGRDPFLPYEEELFVADVSKTHVALLNKFNVMENHLLVVTRAFEDQESLLTQEDFEAMWTVVGDLDDFLLFYNAGPSAGASERHKHLQFVPRSYPLESFFSVERWKELPFRSHFEELESVGREPIPRAARLTRDRYLRSLAAVGRPGDGRAYNLLASRDWMLLVPRSRESFESISVNALGFAGSFLVRNDAALERLRQKGPISVLREVTA